jgi:hypothetical protein
MFWNFTDSLGNYGIIGVGGVIRFIDRDGKKTEIMPAEPSLIVKFGSELKLSDHHHGCVVIVQNKDGRAVLQIQSGFAYPGLEPRAETYEVLL